MVQNENIKLREAIENTFQVTLNYASHEMCIGKEAFKGWKTPILSQPYTLCGFDAAKHDKYINLLERGMRHVSVPGTTPYLDNCDNLKQSFAELQKENRFHALWFGDTLAGICYSDGGEIDRLAVDEKHRFKGLGYYLLYNALQNAFLYIDGNICLYVVDQNPQAFEFYKRCGIQVTGHSARYSISK